MRLNELTFEQYNKKASSMGLLMPIEQTQVWSQYQETIPGRRQWGCYEVEDEGRVVALLNFLDFETHGYHYLRSEHGPVWVEEPTAEQEGVCLQAIKALVRQRDRKVVFVRLAVKAPDLGTQPTLSTIPYDRTVIVDVTGGDDQILARMKPRGRRDVRKALRESPVTCADETEQATASFDEYYDVMLETGQRDGFVPAPISDYQDMLRILGPRHCRLFAGRTPEGKVVTWSMVTITGGRAVRYYAASRNETMRAHVSDKLLYTEACLLGKMGLQDYDLMAIGSEFSPTLMGLNEFKTKFCKQTVDVAPDRDLPVRAAFYTTLQTVRGVIQARRDAKERKAEEARKNAPREDLLPVIVGGDIGAYSLGVELHMAYHVQSICLASAPIAAIAHSSIFKVHPIQKVDAENIAKAVNDIALSNPSKKVFLTGNTDSTIYAINAARDKLPSNVFHAVPSQEVVELVSNKEKFQDLCAKVGVDVPKTQVVSLEAETPVAPVDIAFPLVAKPAVSATYDHLYAKGFKKVYFIQDQGELDELWKSLREAGFHSDFLVQELIAGDDTQIDCLTVYVASDGKPTMFGSAQVLLEDHAPTMLGNPVAMISRPRDDEWKQIEKILAELEAEGMPYRGFCNFDTKRDPESGRVIFMDMNPRIGRGSFYNVAGGVNPMRSCVEDIIDHRKPRVMKTTEKGLFTLVPINLLKRYVDAGLQAEIDELVKGNKVFDPQRYEGDKDPLHRLAVELTERNQIKKFNTFYPARTESSF